MVELIYSKDEIEKIIKEKIRNKKIIKTNNYILGIEHKIVSDEDIMKIYPQFDKVTEIEKEILKQGDIGYELFYQINGDDYSIAMIPKEKIVLFIHAIKYHRNIDKRLKRGRFKR